MHTGTHIRRRHLCDHKNIHIFMNMHTQKNRNIYFVFRQSVTNEVLSSICGVISSAYEGGIVRCRILLSRSHMIASIWWYARVCALKHCDSHSSMVTRRRSNLMHRMRRERTLVFYLVSLRKARPRSIRLARS